MKYLRMLPLLFLFIDGCIDPFDVNTLPAEPVLVVDGLITDQPGPYSVRLFMSSAPSDDSDGLDLVTGASVWIENDQGLSVPLNEVEPGMYMTDPAAIRGQVGLAYSLRMILGDGTEVRSTVETLMPAGEIDSVYGALAENSINQTDPTQPQDAINFYVNGRSDPTNLSGLQRWRSTVIYEIMTWPEYRTRMENDIRVPDPVPCSGYINSQGLLKAVDTCSCCRCWVYEYSRRAVVSPNRFSEGNEYRNISVAEVPFSGDRFFYKFFLEVEQMSVSERVFDFWRRVSAQQEGTGSLFQPNAIRIKGNMHCVTDPRQEVFGVFSASAVMRRSMFLTRRQLPKSVAEPGRITADCRYVVDNSTNVKPPFW